MNTPYDKLIPAIHVELLQLSVEVRSMWRVRIFRIAACERRMQNVESKLHNVSLHLGLAGEAHAQEIRAKWQSTLNESLEILEAVRDLLEEKGWLSRVAGRMTRVLQPFLAILDILGLGSFVRRLLPPPL